MDADEKLTALKKAYADIILSISKEAAARVMASERKSVRYQHELKMAKDEGLRMLMRLKQMMDFQCSEAETSSLNQQKKIEELEAQLQEAEDIVSDLRGELREVHDELERVKNENLHHENELRDACSREIPMRENIYSYQSSEFIPPNESSLASDVPAPYLKNECDKCYNKIVCTCGAHIGNRDLISIIMRGKKPGLYRNGCTQRIRACERNLLDRDLCLSEETGKLMDEKNDKEQESKDTSTAPASGDKSLTELEKKLLTDVQLDGSDSFLKKRKRGVRRRKTVIPLADKQSHLLLKPDENSSKMGSRLSQDKSLTKTQLGCAKTSDNERNLVEISGANTMLKDKGVNEKMGPLSEVTVFSEDRKMDIEKVDVPPDSLELNSSDVNKGISSQPVRERVIKYTFQRKRKRQDLSKSEVNGSLDMEIKTGNGENGDQKPEETKPKLLMESSRDSRRLAQVARQLISLSEKKWWH